MTVCSMMMMTMMMMKVMMILNSILDTADAGKVFHSCTVLWNTAAHITKMSAVCQFGHQLYSFFQILTVDITMSALENLVYQTL